jgi:ribosome-associated protein
MAGVYSAGSQRAQGGDRGWIDRTYLKEHRSQLRNRQAAAHRMSALLTEATSPPPRPRRPTRPSRAARERRLADKQHRAQIKRMRRATDD